MHATNHDSATLPARPASKRDFGQKTQYRVIYCPENDLTFEGQVLINTGQQNCPRRKNKCYGNKAQYIKHGKGTIHHHSLRTTLVGFFQNDIVVGYALQTLFDKERGVPIAHYEGNFSPKLLRHGKGKFIWNATNDVYTGDFINGNMHGNGTFVWGSGDRYEGPFRKGKMHGVGGKKITALTGDCFEGVWKKGKAHGWGAKKFGNGDLYQGQYHYDMWHGFGMYSWRNGDMFIGQWKSGTCYQGVKILTQDELNSTSDLSIGADDLITYENTTPGNITEFYHGQWDGDEAQGDGLKRYSCGDIYLGDYKNGTRNGYGSYTFANEDVYIGHFMDGKCNGLGIKRMANGDVYDGEWKDDNARGYGVKKFWATGDVHSGFYKDDERHGAGTYRWANGDQYEGGFVNGDPDGVGELRWSNSNAYRGSWSRGRKNGPGFYQVKAQGRTIIQYEIWHRGRQLSHTVVTSPWENIASLSELQARSECVNEIKRKKYRITNESRFLSHSF